MAPEPEPVKDESTEEIFAKRVGPMIRSYLSARYVEYGQGKVTLRNMKQHLVDEGGFNLTYEDFRDSFYANLVKSEVDAIASRCDGGKKPVACLSQGETA
eukprot:TRINITY_DN17209_c0_g1_i2.p3 TRINITY_DN17209_c0_g1~~TRINITY_DN17209_c0_g1_i2.p3  ORF type:complete len:100 (+),score=20.48 TRINITY_DN17209_c0_g1_i2:381-680(+)